MAAVGLLSVILPALALVLVVGWAVAQYGQILAALDVRRLYMFVSAAAALLLAVGAAFTLVDSAVSLTWQTYGSEVQLRDSVSVSLGTMVAAGGAWAWHYWQAGRLSQRAQSFTMQRAYLYAMALLGLVGGVVFGGALAAQGMRLATGLVDLGSGAALSQFYRDICLPAVDGTICVILWWSHYRAIRERGLRRL